MVIQVEKGGENNLAKVGVEGSNPFSRSSFGRSDDDLVQAGSVFADWIGTAEPGRNQPTTQARCIGV